VLEQIHRRLHEAGIEIPTAAVRPAKAELQARR